jgi:hypothetical protein
VSAWPLKRFGAFGRERGIVALEHEMNRARHGNGSLVLTFVDVDELKHTALYAAKDSRYGRPRQQRPGGVVTFCAASTRAREQATSP